MLTHFMLFTNPVAVRVITGLAAAFAVAEHADCATLA